MTCTPSHLGRVRSQTVNVELELRQNRRGRESFQKKHLGFVLSLARQLANDEGGEVFLRPQL
jgi:hypothetical protein